MELTGCSNRGTFGPPWVAGNIFEDTPMRKPEKAQRTHVLAWRAVRILGFSVQHRLPHARPHTRVAPQKIVKG